LRSFVCSQLIVGVGPAEEEDPVPGRRMKVLVAAGMPDEVLSISKSASQEVAWKDASPSSLEICLLAGRLQVQLRQV
jgi:hypothetical protein